MPSKSNGAGSLRTSSSDDKIERVEESRLPFTSLTSSPIFACAPAPLSTVSSHSKLPNLASNAPFFQSSNVSTARVTPVVVDDHALSSTPFVAPLRTDPSLIYRQPSPVATGPLTGSSGCSNASDMFHGERAGSLLDDINALASNSASLAEGGNTATSPFSHAYLGGLGDCSGVGMADTASSAAGLAGIWTSVDSAMALGKLPHSMAATSYRGALSPPASTATPLSFSMVYNGPTNVKPSSPDPQGQSPMAPPPQFSDKFLYDGDNDDDAMKKGCAAVNGGAAWDRNGPPFSPPFAKVPIPAKLDVTHENMYSKQKDYYPVFQPLANAELASNQYCSTPLMQSPFVPPNVQNGGGNVGPFIPALGMNLQPSTTVCRFFLQGYCTRGDRCNYTHLPPSVMLSCASRELIDQLAAAGALGPPPSTRRPNKTPNTYFANKAQPNVNYYGGGKQHKKAPDSVSYVEGYYPMTLAPSADVDASIASLSNGLGGMSLKGSSPANASNGATSRRNNSNGASSLEEVNRFLGVPLEELTGQLGFVCRDQDGCRYLQKMLEEGNPKHVETVFNEIFPSFVELMTDPFGNYLCQKLVEYATDEQKTLIVEAVSPNLIDISLNMHGTRAVQKMIEYLSLPQHLRTIAVAFSRNVVALIKDLNGNHVIQKCLNRLSPEHDQFIYDAVTKNLVEISTHRHGCCVLQRCIDHASEQQRRQLVNEITLHALELVQDPFANYVVQYIIDLNQAEFSGSIIRKFLGHICLLSVQKFSSNVIEKCIRAADPKTRSLYIGELNNREVLERLIRDSFGNYVVQTALDYSNPIERSALVESIRPLLPAIRNTPYGKRFSSKLHRDNISPPPNALGNCNGLPGLSGKYAYSKQHSITDESNSRHVSVWSNGSSGFKEDLYQSGNPITAWPRLRKV